MSRSKDVRRTLCTIIGSITVLTACGDRASGPANLTPAEVGGVYRVCALAFQPNQALLPAVNVRAVAMDTTPEATVPARLFVDNQSLQAELEFSAPGSTLPRRYVANYQLGSRSLLLTFGAPAAVMTELLLPASLEMDFEAEPNLLTFQRANHDVPRQRYAALANQSEEGLAENIRGTISGEFRVGSCS